MREFEKLYCGRYYEIDRDLERVCGRCCISMRTGEYFLLDLEDLYDISM